MSPPPRRPLGRSGLSVAPFALGGNVFGKRVEQKVGFQILDAFVDAGFNLVDTADVYQGSESEQLIGAWFQESGRRKEVLLATKVGMDMGPAGKGLSEAHIRSSIDASLQRLRTDHIDLYQAHRDDPDVPLEETLAAFDELITEGKVRALGASNYEADRLEEALTLSRERGWHRFECLQPWYNLMDRQEYERSLQAVCLERGLGVIPYLGLASGFLTGKYRSKADLSKSPRGTRVESRLTERGFRILAGLDEVARRLGSRPATVALAWLMAQPSITAPIASATTPEQLGELVEAASLRIDPDSMRVLDEASAEASPGPPSPT